MKQLEIRSTNFKHLQNSFTEWLDIRGYVPRTVKMSPILLQEFFHFLEQQQVLHINKVEQKHALAFKLHLQHRLNHKYKSGGICNQTINGILQVMNCFEKFFNESSVGFKLDIYLDYLPVETPPQKVLTQQEVKALYMQTFEMYPNNLGSQEMGQRDRVMLAIFYGCGLRRDEGRQLNINDIDFQNRRLIVRNGKGNKQRYVPIPNQHLEDIRMYIQQGRYWFGEHHHQSLICYKRSIKKEVTPDDNEALFLNQFGKRMMSFGQRLDYLTGKTGIRKKTGTHVLRRSLGTHLYQNGMELEQISKVLGHASNDMTTTYVYLAHQLENELTF